MVSWGLWQPTYRGSKVTRFYFNDAIDASKLFFAAQILFHSVLEIETKIDFFQSVNFDVNGTTISL